MIKNKKQIFIFSVALVFLATISSEAGEILWEGKSPLSVIKGINPADGFFHGQLSCYEYPDYTVMEKSGEIVDILVKPRKMRCVGLKEEDLNQENIFRETGDHERFLGMYGNLLFVESVDAPGRGGITIYDLSTLKKVHQGFYAQPFTIEVNKKFSAWLVTDKADRKNCLEYEEMIKNAGSADIETKVFIDLNDFNVSKTTVTRCE